MWANFQTRSVGMGKLFTFYFFYLYPYKIVVKIKYEKAHSID